MSASRPARGDGAGLRRPLALALLGLVLTILGIGGYLLIAFGWGAWLPRVRNHALPNWLAVGIGVGLSVLALVRSPRGRRVAPAVALGVNGVLAAAFVWLLYGMTAVPGAEGPAIGTPAPDFMLRDQTGTPARLADFRGKPLVLVFYRGHW